MTGVDSIAQKLDAIINVRIDSEQILSLLGILVMKKSTIKNSWMVEMGLYNPRVSLLLLISYRAVGKESRGGGEDIKIFESKYPLMSVPVYNGGGGNEQPNGKFRRRN